MNYMRRQKSWRLALVAILLLIAACKGETPTAPPSGSPGNPGNTPVSNANIALTVSSTTPLINSTVTVTATVTLNGSPVPDGTAVQFSASNDATFSETGTGVTIRTTTNGVASTTVTKNAAGVTRITAVVNNVAKTADITFREEAPCTPPDPRCPVVTTPTITSVTPAIGRPQGGEQIRIIGTNFKAPVRVLFDLGTGNPVEAFVVSVTSTEIVVTTPAVNLGTGQQLAAKIIVITEAGSITEQRVTKDAAFTFRNEQLTPVVYSLSPASGPINGGTMVKIFGEGFQAPVQVFFGSAEARVVEVKFGEIYVEAPDGRSTSADGSGTVTGPVPVSVVNILSNRRATSPTEFRYVAKMAVTAIRPLSGSSLGGTDITIDGVGFDAPVAVTIGGIAATVLRVSGTQLLVRTNSLNVPCADVANAPIVITNVENGDNATFIGFSFFGVPPLISAALPVTSPLQPGGLIDVTVRTPGAGPLGTGNIRFTVLDRNITPSPSQTTDPTATTTFRFALPSTGFTFPTVSCTTATFTGTQLGPIEVPITFRNVTTGCTDSIIVPVQPPTPNPCVQAPAVATQTAPAPGSCANAGTAVVGVASTSPATITFRNTAAAGAQALVVTNNGATPAGEFTVTPASQTINPGFTGNFTVNFTPTGPNARSSSVTFTTNDPNNPSFTVCLQGTGTTPPP